METEKGERMLPDEQPDSRLRNLDEEMMDSMTEIDHKILAEAILGVDITEVYSPERVANVAQRVGLNAGSPFDLAEWVAFQY